MNYDPNGRFYLCLPPTALEVGQTWTDTFCGTPFEVVSVDDKLVWQRTDPVEEKED